MKLNSSHVQHGMPRSSNIFSTVRKVFVCFAMVFLLAAFAAPALAQFNEGFESGIPNSWTFSGPAGLDGTATSSSGLGPTQGTYYGWISTGCLGDGDLLGCPTVAMMATPSYSSLGLTPGAELNPNGPTVETTLTSPSFTLTSPGGVVSFDVNFITTDGTYSFADFGLVQLVPLGEGAPPAINLFVANTTLATSTAVPPNELTPGVANMSPSTAYFTGTTVSFGSTNFGDVPKYGGGNGGPSAWIHVTYLAQPGTYELQFLVSHVGDTNYPSALAIDNVQTSQTVEAGTLAPGTTTTATFNSAEGQELIHTLKLPTNVTYQNGVTDPQMLSTNIVVSNNGGIQPYTFHTPFATGTLLEQQADDLLAGGSGYGSLIADKCYQYSSDPSTATFTNCPVSTPTNPTGPSPADLFNLTVLFDFPNTATMPDVAPGTTISFVHHPGQKYGPNTDLSGGSLPPTPDWVPVASGATSNPVCNDVQWNFTTGATNDCSLEDPLLYDTAITTQAPGIIWGVFGDQAGSGTGIRGRGVVGLMNNVPMLTTKVSINGYALNVPGVQDMHGPYWFNAQSLSLDFLVNPAQLPAGTVNSNGWYAAPPLELAYKFYNGAEPLLPSPANCENTPPTGSTCLLKSGTPGIFTPHALPPTGMAAPIEFGDTIPSSAFAEGVVNTLAWTGRDTVTGERNIQLLHSGNCPDPDAPFIPQPAQPPCYSTSLFYELIGKDTTPPAITITTPVNNATYVSNQSVPANYSCSDPTPGSGLASCAGPVSPGSNIDTTLGANVPTAKTFKVNATDNALPPNASSASVTYYVGYNFAGFTSPIGNPPVINVVKAGRTIPIGWQVLTANGVGITGLQLSAQNGGVAGGTVVLTSTNSTLCSHDTLDNTVVVGAAGNSGLQDLGGGNYQFNWKTTGIPSGACQQLTVNPGDGSSHVAYFQFK